MKTRRWLLNAVTAAILVTLGACGGGGGDPAPTLIAITAANRDTLAHATVAGVWGLTLGVTAPLASGSPGSGRSMAAWLQTQRQRAASAVQRERPMAVRGPEEVACQVSGTMTVTWNDADNSGGGLTVGDVVTTVFNNCQQVAGETTNGTMVLAVVSQAALRVAMTQWSFDTARHAITLDGSVRLEDVSADTLQTTTEGEVTVAVTLKHLAPAFVDTVTLQDGFVARETYGSGETVSTLNGLLRSRVANGRVQLTTPTTAPIRQFDANDYPHSGALQIAGLNSTLQMTVLSANDVRLDLDADNNGSFESTSTVTWDWLL